MGQRGGQGRAAGWLAAMMLIWGTSLTGCGQGAAVAPSDATVTGRVDVPWGASDAGSDAAADAADVSTRFPCPEGWVASEHGGCGPAVLLCAPDGGAAEGACEGNDPTSPATVRDPDGVEGTRFYRLPDGGIGGGWSTPWVCPTGWTNAPEGHCRPTLRDDCPRYSGPLPDGTCTPTDESRCPPGGFPEVPPEAAGQRVVYVRQMATLTPDGSMRAPYPDLNQAVAAEPEAEWFLLYPGYYPVGFTVRHPMHILGGCAANVQLTGTNGVRLFNLDGPAIRLDLRGVNLAGGSHGVFAEHGAVATIRACIFSGTRYNAIEVNHGATVEAVDSLFSDLDPASMGHHGIAGGGGTLTLRRSSFPGTAYISVIAENAGATAIVENVAIRGTRATTVQATDGATLTLRQASIRGPTQTAVMIGRDARAEIEDLSVRDSYFVGTTSSGNSTVIVAHSTLTGRRISIENASSGISVTEDSARADLDQFFLRTMRGDVDAGHGISVQNFAHLSLRRAQLVDITGIGIVSTLFGFVDVRDSLIHRVAPLPNSLFGIGMAVNVVGSLDARRMVIEEASMIGIGAIGLPERVTRLVDLNMVLGRPVDPRALVTLEDVIVRNARPLERYPSFGVGTGVAGAMTGRRVSVDQQPSIAVVAADFGFPTEVLLAYAVRAGLLPAANIAALRILLGPVLDGPSSVAIDGLFVRGARRWLIDYDPITFATPFNVFGSYSFYTGPRCTFTATDVTLDGSPSAEIGLASLGATTLRRGVITRHTGCAATLNNTNGSAAITLDSITLSGNGRDATCADDALPSVRLPLSPN
ncbi:MAG: right-handed parallel beta-helix repeat-containing protein [Deltaproteobacteria bacterium]|nr:right-handed parallel beta-helix repeat-containing protein [Deltaproteobacteria bacterium]